MNARAALDTRIRIAAAARDFPEMYRSPLLIARMSERELELLSGAWKLVLGWPAEGLAGHPLQEFVAGAGMDGAVQLLQCAIRDGRAGPIEFALIGRDHGRLVRRQFAWHALFDEYEGKIFIVGAPVMIPAGADTQRESDGSIRTRS